MWCIILMMLNQEIMYDFNDDIFGNDVLFE